MCVFEIVGSVLNLVAPSGSTGKWRELEIARDAAPHREVGSSGDLSRPVHAHHHLK
jgi:hypothetical protein